MSANDDIIRLLPDSVANQIAAGEVIQRPASVVKELVENSIDAGATTIDIIIEDAGRTLIQVVDDGKGMSPTDARMAFERHATSKITSATDLYSLHTMGFRGEALASIAAVAQIDLRTMRRSDNVGNRLIIADSKVELQEPAACSAGTNLMVKNIFAYLPARRKFLKKDSVELSHIVHEFERLALVNTNVDFKLIHNGVTLHQLHRSSLKTRITALFGKSLDHQLLPITTETTIVRINGFVSLPQFTRKRGAQQFFFVNGRNLRHPYFHKAVLNCYAELSASDTQPCYFINLEVDPERIDVNIHPQKHEIKFEDEQAIWQILTAAIKEAIGKSNAAGAIDFDVEDAPEIPLFDPDAAAIAPGTNADPNYNPFTAVGPSDTPAYERQHIDRDWEMLYEGFSSQMPGSQRQSAGTSAPVVSRHFGGDKGGGVVSSRLNATDSDNFNAPVGEIPADIDLGLGFEARPDSTQARLINLHNRYIVSASKSGLMVVDRHRAHVKVLYDRFVKRLAEAEPVPQPLLFPQAIELSPAGSVALQTYSDQLSALGFDLASLGDNSWNITAVPAMVAHVDAEQLLMLLIEQLDTESEGLESIIGPVALTMARAAAVKADTPWTDAECETLLDDLLTLSQPDFTPDGLTIIRTISNRDLERMFE